MTDKTPDIAEQSANITPDFFVIPTVVLHDPELQSLDAIVFGVVYWFEKMKDGYCRASNATIAKVAKSSPSGVANSLVRLRNAGHIGCEFDDNNHRLAIVTLTHFSKGGYSNEERGVTQSSNILKNNNIKDKYTDEEKQLADNLHRLYVLYYRIKPSVNVHLLDDERKALVMDSYLAKYKLTPKRMAVAVARLRDAGYEMCAEAISKSSENDFNLGHNDRGWKADLYDYILRNYEQVEKLSQQGN